MGAQLSPRPLAGRRARLGAIGGDVVGEGAGMDTRDAWFGQTAGPSQPTGFGGTTGFSQTAEFSQAAGVGMAPGLSQPVRLSRTTGCG
ncbi:hypothetical protein Actkin_01308 [Actinokineospora sp. UTMC 2448]|nr:hypothetical protein Actkin_01308 [Actinokineospora sp. UTMC 2448]